MSPRSNSADEFSWNFKYGNLQSQGAYTKVIGLVPKIKELPFEFARKVKIIFNAAKTPSDIAKDLEMTKARAAIE